MVFVLIVNQETVFYAQQLIQMIAMFVFQIMFIIRRQSNAIHQNVAKKTNSGLTINANAIKQYLLEIKMEFVS